MPDPLAAMPFQRSFGSATIASGFSSRIGLAGRQRHNLVTGRAAHGIARRIGIIRRPFPPGPLPQNTAQPQKDEDGERQEDNGVDIEHVLHALGGGGGGPSAMSDGHRYEIASRRRHCVNLWCVPAAIQG